MKPFNPYAPERLLLVFKRHLPIIIKPAIFAVATLFLWQYLHAQGVYFGSLSEGTFAGTAVAFLSIVYSIMAALVINSIWDDYKAVSFCLVRNDKETFLTHRDERMPIMIHLLLGIPSLLLLVSVMFLGWADVTTGSYAVFAVSFVIALFFVVAIELDDPKRSIWFKERIPAEWLTIDVDAFMKAKRASEEKR